MNLPEGPILIPEAFHQQSVEDWGFSQELARHLEELDVKRFGKLERYCYEDLGMRTVEGADGKAVELCRVVALLWCVATSEIPLDFSGERVTPEAIYVPESIRHVPVEVLELGLVFGYQLDGYSCFYLGDLHGLTRRQFLKWRTCGPGRWKLLWEKMAKVYTGEIDAESHVASRAPVQLVELIRLGCDRMDRNHWELLGHFVASKGGPEPTLEKAARWYGCKLPEAEQMIDEAREFLLNHMGTCVPELLRKVKQAWLPPLCPLTVPLLGRWMGGRWGIYQFTMEAAVRLIGILDDSLHCWTEIEGSKPLPRTGRTEFEVWLVKQLKAGGPAPIAKIFFEMTKVDPWKALEPDGFLAQLVEARGVRFDFENPEAPVVRLRSQSRQ